jgi:hypothetical protein
VTSPLGRKAVIDGILFLGWSFLGTRRGPGTDRQANFKYEGSTVRIGMNSHSGKSAVSRASITFLKPKVSGTG